MIAVRRRLRAHGASESLWLLAKQKDASTDGQAAAAAAAAVQSAKLRSAKTAVDKIKTNQPCAKLTERERKRERASETEKTGGTIFGEHDNKDSK